MVWLAFLSAFAAEPDERVFGHDRCGGIPGGMFDQFERQPDGLRIRMHRYTMDDANVLNLGLVFLDAGGRPLKRWRGQPSRSVYAESAGAWLTDAVVPVPDGAFAAHLFDLHYDRRCVLLLTAEGDVQTVEVGVPGGRKTDAGDPVSRTPREEVDETLEGEAVKVKRSGRAKLVEQAISDAPDDLELRARKLANLKRNLSSLEESQVLEWMGFQGFKPDDADVIEMLGANWRDLTRPKK